jgi:DnaK suppressor protein
VNQGKLTDQELAAFRRQLESLVARLSGGVAELRESEPVPADRQGDMSSHTAEEEVALTLIGTEESVLAEAKAALGRLDRGTFGTCASCGQPIARARLDAIPYAAHCIGCARASQGNNRG